VPDNAHRPTRAGVRRRAGAALIDDESPPSGGRCPLPGPAEPCYDDSDDVYSSSIYSDGQLVAADRAVVAAEKTARLRRWPWDGPTPTGGRTAREPALSCSSLTKWMRG